MPRSQHSEMALVQRGEFRFVQAFHYRQHSCIDKTDVGIGVSVAQVADASIVGGFQWFRKIGTGDNVAEQGGQRVGMQAFVNPVVHFDENRSRNRQRLGTVLD